MTKDSNIWACEGHSYSNHYHTTWLSWHNFSKDKSNVLASHWLLSSLGKGNEGKLSWGLWDNLSLVWWRNFRRDSVFWTSCCCHCTFLDVSNATQILHSYSPIKSWQPALRSIMLANLGHTSWGCLVLWGFKNKSRVFTDFSLVTHTFSIPSQKREAV